MNRDDKRIVLLDGVIALTNISLGTMLAGTVVFAANQWWVGVVVAIVTGVLFAASDRSHAGMQAMIAVGVVSIVALAWAWITNMIIIGTAPIVMIGLGIGSGLNRFLFGVIRPIPTARQRRQHSK